MFACNCLTITNSKHFSSWYVKKPKPNRITAKDDCKRYGLPSCFHHLTLTNVNPNLKLKSHIWIPAFFFSRVAC